VTQAILEENVISEPTDASPEQQHKWVYVFEEGNGENKALFCSKCAGLCDMTRT